MKQVEKAKTRLDPKSLPKVSVPGLPNANIIQLFCTEEDGNGNIFIVTGMEIGSENYAPDYTSLGVSAQFKNLPRRFTAQQHPDFKASRLRKTSDEVVRFCPSPFEQRTIRVL